MPAGGLSERQHEILAEMGIDVWVSRRPDHGSPAFQNRLPDPAQADELLALNKEILTCTRCELHETRTQAVCGTGSVAANLLIIGEAPGADEDQQGEPFVGRAGQLLNQMLKAIGLDRDAVYIANILKCRPPQNRDPRPAEVEQCLPFLQRQIALIRPRLILLVGGVAAHNLLQTDTPVGKLRGQLHYYGEQQTPVVVTYHPAYLLRSPTQKAKSYADLLLALDVLQSEEV